jgi:hypothetical protein
MLAGFADGEHLHAVVLVHRRGGERAGEFAEELLRPELEDQVLAVGVQAQVRELDFLLGQPFEIKYPLRFPLLAPLDPRQHRPVVEGPVDLLQPPGMVLRPQP